MRKKLSALLAGAMLMAGASSALAVPVPLPSEWGIIQPTATIGTPTYNTTRDFGYFLWTDDIERTSWHLRWMDGTHAGVTTFSGTISLQNNLGSFDSFSFESGDSFGFSTTGAGYFSQITTGQDGVDFTITKNGDPSYVGFDLDYMFGAMDPTKIFIGGIEQTVASLGEDQDFAIAAPVPEPGTMMLLGAGFLGLAIYGKRRKNA